MPPPIEISIPTTALHTPADGSKPYTLYTITLRLPLRSYVCQKRYSDFHNLHGTLTNLVGSSPPAPLPGKKWFKSTVSSMDLTEHRRVGLEAYLRAIAESPDRRWRDTAAWRAFLNLPNSTNNSAASASSIGPIDGRPAARLAAASDPAMWLDLHRELKDALHEARKALARRDAVSEPGARAEAGAASKKHIIRAGSLLAGLADGLKGLKEGGRLGDGELRRRQDLVSAARLEKEGLERLVASLSSGPSGGLGGGGGGSGRQGMPSASDKAALLGSGPRTGGRVLGAPLPETERTRERDNEGVLQLQQQMMEDQDREVELLAQVVRRQKELGLRIGEEVEYQTQELTRMDQDVDRVNQKVRVAKERTRKLGGKS